MKYQSTRNSEISFSSAEAIKTGIAPDGGLFVPSEIPSLSLAEIENTKNMSYVELADFVLGKFLTDFTAEEVHHCTSNAYTKEKFESDTIAPLYKLNDTTSILELWHGPTCAFKDMALQILPYLLTKSMKKTGEEKEVIILVATSGDTGKAALEGFKDVEGTNIQVFYPVDGVSNIQKLQMATQLGNNVNVTAVKGNFDDAQTGVKKIFSNDDMRKKADDMGYVFSSANSINWGRLVPQIVYYFYSYATLLKNEEIKIGDKINIVVPTGNFGNILAAFYAKCMGIPVNKLICASNKNNVLTDFINTGVYDRNRKFETTISPSMDILISSNLERFIYHMSGENASFVADCMKKLNDEGRYDVGAELTAKIKEIFVGGFTSDEETVETIRRTNEKYSYIPDTHTSVAIKVYEDYVKETGDDTKTVIASTANPFKFNQSVLSALVDEKEMEGKDEFELLEMLSKVGNLTIPSSLSNLKKMDVRFKDVCDKEEMWDMVHSFLSTAPKM